MSHDQSDSLTARVVIMRILIGALVTGILFFAGIAAFLRSQDQPPAPETPVLTYIGLGFTALSVIARVFVIQAVEAAFRRRAAASAPPVEQYWTQYQTNLIIGAALLEAPGFFLLIAYLLEGQTVALAAGLLLAAAMAVWHFTTRDKVERWVQLQQELVAQERAA